MVKGMSRRLNLSETYWRAVRRCRANQLAVPATRKKKGIPHKLNRVRMMVMISLCSAFLICHGKKSKGWTAWKRKTIRIASTRSQSR